VTSEDLLNRLVRVRELRLMAEAARLKGCATVLSEIQSRLEQAQLAACASTQQGITLFDLGAIGETRLSGIRRRVEIRKEIVELSDKVTHASRMTESARHARSELIKEKRAAVELSSEKESEQFLNWKRASKTQR